MIEVGLALLGACAALILAQRVRQTWARQLTLAAIGLLAIGAAAVLSEVIDCAGCTPAIGPRFAAFLAAGWLVGIAVVQVRRRRRGSIRRPRTASVTVAVALLLFALGVVVYGRYGYAVWMWGCPTNDELHRVQSVEEVVGAFEDHDLPLEPIPFPVWMPRDEPAYRGARLFRYATPQATLYVIVCRGRCSLSRARSPFADARVLGEQRWYMSLESNDNVPILVTESGRGDGLRMLETTAAARREVQPYIEYGSRCYIN